MAERLEDNIDAETSKERFPKQAAFNLGDVVTENVKILSDAEKAKLEEQNKRMVTAFQALKLEQEARKHWDLFYKRNENRFFKDRHWTTREFSELLSGEESAGSDGSSSTPPHSGIPANGESDGSGGGKKLLEIGCGVGNLIFPLIEDGHRDYFIYACDLSPRAVELVQKHNLYDERYMKAFACDITTQQVFETLADGSLDIVTLIFVLSAIHPDKFRSTVANIHRLLKPGGVVLFRDYGLYDMAQLRFKPGHKIAENFYMRQDGTRSYYFAEQEVSELFRQAGFTVLVNSYIHRRTINPKENIDVPRIFVQGKFLKPPSA
ncbi:tRNA N(3)-methylcytidine methyltransferase METTL6 [Anopheles stephensi]|uniref:tRNA N(3)-methylcytidine methyltransferase n=1 Tax=Anopheles stephensi TaxID=30069 RepID=A0A182YDH6_ANOST|nr:tRNA N(3)-methylcytidine methyltransferase METTL6 [Anopheles stephensi]XP_035915019.1 tRNA N(3)-methylcytidine methyltransferase METTL6 [Anopheles stephensi]